MDSPTGDVDGCADAHRRLLAVAANVSEEQIRRPSALPGWSVGHVLTHLEQNAEAMCRRIEAATRGELIDQYAGGTAGRAAQVEAGAGRDLAEIVLGVSRSATRLDEWFASLTPEVWARPVRTVAGGEHPVADLPFRRWREVEVHLVDVGLGATADQWSVEFAERALPRLIAGLPDRSDPRELAAWILGRGPAPNLGPWA